MKKILLVALSFTVATTTQAQLLQNQHKTCVHAETWWHCADSYTQWCLGAFDTLNRIQNTAAFPAYFFTWDFDGISDPGVTPDIWVPASGFQINGQPYYGDQPSFSVDNTGLPITEMGYMQFNSAGTAFIYTNLVDTISSYVHSLTASPATVSVGFTKTMVTPDSVLIHTKMRFNINDSAQYSVVVYAIEDSARGYQATSIPGVDTLPHRQILRGAIQSGFCWGYTFLAGWAHAGDIFTQDFTQTIPAGWNIAKLSYLVVVYRWDAAGYKHMVNTTDGNFDLSALQVTKQINPDITDAMKVYPVPAKDYVNIEMNISQPMSDCSVDLFDISGKRAGHLYSGTVEPSSPLTLQLPQGLPAGNYMLQLSNGQTSAVKQVTIK